MTSLNLGIPVPGQRVNVGQAFFVSGTATGTGGAEPRDVQSVTVQVDNQSPVEANLVVHPHTAPMYKFSVEVQVTGGPGPHNILVTATDETLAQARSTVTVWAIDVQAAKAKAPGYILEIKNWKNPDPPSDFSNTGAATIAYGKPNPSSHFGGPFPSLDALQEWKQVLLPEEDYEDFSLVGASGWVFDPNFSGADVPFDHPFRPPRELNSTGNLCLPLITPPTARRTSPLWETTHPYSLAGTRFLKRART